MVIAQHHGRMARMPSRRKALVPCAANPSLRLAKKRVGISYSSSSPFRYLLIRTFRTHPWALNKKSLTARRDLKSFLNEKFGLYLVKFKGGEEKFGEGYDSAPYNPENVNEEIPRSL